MLIKLFVLGPPGSGKSTVARHIVHHIRKYYKDWHAIRVSDYEYLNEMFQKDQHVRFESIKNGFCVLDESVYDEALQNLVHLLRSLERSSLYPTVLVIEFARPDYTSSWSIFQNDLLKDAHFLFLQAEVAVGKERVEARLKKPGKEASHMDNHNVPEQNFASFYGKDTLNHTLRQTNILREYFNKYDITLGEIGVIKSSVAVRIVLKEVNKFLNQIFLCSRKNSLH